MLVIVDIDGTIADWKPREQAAGSDPGRADIEAYKAYISRLMDTEELARDRPVSGMVETVKAFAFQPNTTLLYLTGRSEIYRNVTEEWLALHNFPPGMLHMRDKNDWRPAPLYKEAVIREESAKHKTIVALEDEQSVVDMMTGHGITVLKVCYE
jgi:FMN phosphatase YigB (HAD superfamily)